MSGTPSDNESYLFAYMHGWRVGAKGALLPDIAGDDFRQGHEEGRKAADEAYRAACRRYGTTLSVLRSS